MSTSTTTIPVIGAAPGTTVELVPGKKFLPLPLAAMQPVAICEVVPAGEGTFRPVARVCSQWFSLNQENLRRLGIGISRAGMKRLIVAGFLVGQQTTPGVYQFDYFSFREHAAKAQNPEFWEETAPGQNFTNRQRYSAAI